MVFRAPAVGENVEYGKSASASRALVYYCHDNDLTFRCIINFVLAKSKHLVAAFQNSPH